MFSKCFGFTMIISFNVPGRFPQKVFSTFAIGLLGTVQYISLFSA